MTLKQKIIMLKVKHISNIEIYSPEWHQCRLGKFTSSRIHTLMGEKPLSDGAMTYIMHKVGEEITGHTTAEDENIEDENTVWGLQNEPHALQMFGKRMQIEFLVTQKMIHNEESRFSSTPDAIWTHNKSLHAEEHNVSTVEVKCPRKYHKYIPFYRCRTPSQLKSISKVYYWQVLDQMDNCDSAIGYFAVYHPLFPEGGNFNVIEFRKIDLWDDFKLLKQRKKIALEEFERLRFEMIGV